MKLEADIFGIVALFAILHSFVIAAFLISQRRRRGVSALYLGIAHLSGAMILVSSLIASTNLFSLFPALIGVPYPFMFFTGLFSLYYVYSLVEKSSDFIGRLWPFLLISLAGMGLSLPLYLMDGADRQRYLLFIFENHNYQPYDWVIWTFGLVYNWAVLVIALLRIHRYRNTLQEELSNTQGIELKTMEKMIWFMLICWGGITLLSVLSYNRLMVEISLNLSALFPAVYLISMSYGYLLDFFRAVPLQNHQNPLKGKIPKAQSTELFNLVRQEMEHNKYYLDPELTLPLLAENIKYYRNELSEVINSQSGTNFYHFVNSYRIKHFTDLLKENRERNILDLALASGFNSKAAFYNAFKRVTGITPRQYIVSERNLSCQKIN